MSVGTTAGSGLRQRRLCPKRECGKTRCDWCTASMLRLSGLESIRFPRALVRLKSRAIGLRLRCIHRNQAQRAPIRSVCCQTHATRLADWSKTRSDPPPGPGRSLAEILLAREQGPARRRRGQVGLAPPQSASSIREDRQASRGVDQSPQLWSVRDPPCCPIPSARQ
jgi:hypothetical protein